MSLDCYFCGREFNDFYPLAKHVQRVHVNGMMDDGEENDMNVGSWVGSGSSERLPLLDGKMFKKLQVKGRVTGKILAVRDLTQPRKGSSWKGIALDLKNGTRKFGFLCSVDRFDIGAIVNQLKSEETDDWIGQTIKFVTNIGKKGGLFVNVENPKQKK